MGASVSAAADPVRLSLTPVGPAGVPAGSPASYFTLTAAPGDRVQLTVRLGNAGASTVTARTFAADAYTINNGGFGARLDGEPTSGATTWLEYEPTTFNLGAGTSVDRAFAVTIPSAAQPGEYLTSLVIQNAEPVPGSDSQGEVGVAFRQVNRQAIAVSITVPGALRPGLEIGAATHSTVAGTSSVSIAVRNVGNVRLTPSGELVLYDLDGEEISRVPIRMDSFYAGTETFVEVAFAELLNAGQYTASLSLTAVAAGGGARVTAASERLSFLVPTPEEAQPPLPPPAGVAAVPQRAPVKQGPPAVAASSADTRTQLGSDTAQLTESSRWIPSHWMLGGLGLLVFAVGAGFGLVVRRRAAPEGA